MTGIIGLAAVWLAWSAIWQAVGLYERRVERQKTNLRRLIEQARQDEWNEDPMADIAAIVIIDVEQYLKAADRRRRRIEDMEGM